MIHYIEIENFYSISEKQIIDFRHKPLKSDINPLTNSRADNKISIPPVIGLFGANASGKTTALRAISSVVKLLKLSAENQLPKIGQFFQPYLSENTWDKPTKIIIELDGEYFEKGKIENPFDAIMRYELHIGNNYPDRLKKTIIFESLSFKKSGGRIKNLYTRTNKEINFRPDFKYGLIPLIEQTISEETSVLGRLSIFNHRISRYLIELLHSFISNIDGLIKVQENPAFVADYYKLNTNILNQLNKELPRFDLGIEEMRIDTQSGQNIALVKHSDLDEELLFFEESNGTRKFIELFPIIDVVLKNGGIAILDEIDTDLHPNLIPEIFSWFYDEQTNPYKAQLLFTAHNASLLNHLNRNQIYITEKPFGHGSNVYCAADIEGLRSENNITKKYLAGELGGVPIIG